MQEQKIAVILSGGGARAAYQAGALKAIAEITQKLNIPQPFSIYSGTSAGAINAAYMVSHADRWRQATIDLAELWSTVYTEQVFKTDFLSLTSNTLSLLKNLLLTRTKNKRQTRSLLDTQPLWDLLCKKISFDRIHEHIQKGIIDSFVVTALNYSDGMSHIFYETNRQIEPWIRERRFARKSVINASHVMASSAIPLLFPPIKVNGTFYGDGALRSYTPLSPAIHLGANRLLVITVRKKFKPNQTHHLLEPSLGRILSIALNSIFLDSIDMDYERITRINETLKDLSPNASTPLRPIDVCILRPSRDLGEIAREELASMPKYVRYLLTGLGNKGELSEIISYLLFESAFTKRLVDLGYQDTRNEWDKIGYFFLKTPP